jgi:hypothetical protein
MGVVSAYSGGGAGVAGAQPASQYLGSTSQVGHVGVGGQQIVPAVDWTGGQGEGVSAEVEEDDFVWVKPRHMDEGEPIRAREFDPTEDDIPEGYVWDEEIDPEDEVDPLDSDDEDPELPDWVEEEYGGLHEGLETAEIVSVETKQVKRGPGRPRKVKV